MIRSTVVVLLAMLLQTSSYGQSDKTKIAWRLPVGRKIDVVMKQTMEMQQIVSGQEFGKKVVSTNYMLWEVDKVDDAGIATVNNEIERLTMSIEGPQGKFDIDSASEEELEDGAAQFAEQVKELVGKQFSQTMNVQGKILSVDMPDGFASGNPMITKEALSQLIKNASPVFPDKHVGVGETWNQESITTLPNGVGDMKINSTFTYKGTEEIDGKTLDLIGIATEMDFQAPIDSPLRIEITNQDTKGQMYFDSVEGHTSGIDIVQNIVMQVVDGAQTITQKVLSRTEGTFSVRQ